MKSRTVALILSAALLQSSFSFANEAVGPECAIALAVVETSEIAPTDERSSTGRHELFQMLMVDQAYFLSQKFIDAFFKQFERPELKGRKFVALDADEQDLFVNRLIENAPPQTEFNKEHNGKILRQGPNGIYYQDEVFPAITDQAYLARFESLVKSHLHEVVRDFLLQQELFYINARKALVDSGGGEYIVGTTFASLFSGAFGAVISFGADFHGMIITPIVVAIPMILGIRGYLRYRKEVYGTTKAKLAEYQNFARGAFSLPAGRAPRTSEALRLAPARRELMQGRTSLITVQAVKAMIPAFDAAKPSTIIDFGGDIERAIHTFSNAFNLRIFGRPSTSAFQAFRLALADALDKTAKKDKTVTAISNRLGGPLEDLQQQTKFELEENLYFQEVQEVLSGQLKIYQAYLDDAQREAMRVRDQVLLSRLEAKRLELAEFAKGLAMVGDGLRSEEDQIVSVRRVTTDAMNFMIQRLSNSNSNKIEENDLEKLRGLQAAFVKL